MIFVHSGGWPFERKAWLRNAANLTFSLELMSVGAFYFELPSTDSNGIKPGDLIAITSPHVFVGYVDRIAQQPSGARARIDGTEWSGVLASRILAQEKTYPSGAAGDIFRDVLRRTSSRNPTGITPIPTGGSAPITSPFVSRARNVVESAVTLADRTGWEWQIVYSAKQVVTAQAVWAARVGKERRNQVHLQGRAISSASYAFDLVGDHQLVQVIGDLGEFADRPSAVATDGPVALQDIAKTRVPVKTRKQRRSIFTARETTILESSLPDGIAVQRRALEDVQAVQNGQEAVSLTLTPLAPKVGLGDTVTVHLPATAFRDAVVRAYRVYGLQPDVDAGTVDVIGRVVT